MKSQLENSMRTEHRQKSVFLISVHLAHRPNRWAIMRRNCTSRQTPLLLVTLPFFLKSPKVGKVFQRPPQWAAFPDIHKSQHASVVSYQQVDCNGPPAFSCCSAKALCFDSQSYRLSPWGVSHCENGCSCMYSQVVPCDLCLTISTPGERILWTRWTSQMRNVNHVPVFSPRREGYLSTVKLRLHTWESFYNLRLEGGNGWQEDRTFPRRESNPWPTRTASSGCLFWVAGCPCLPSEGAQ